MEALRQRIAELESEQLRERAEGENQRKRWLREFEQARKFGVDRLLNAACRRSTAWQDQGRRCSGAGIDSLKQGSEMTLRMLQKAADSHGLTAVDPLGSAVQSRSASGDRNAAVDQRPGRPVATVVLQKGYRLHDRLVRPALVMVSQG